MGIELALLAVSAVSTVLQISQQKKAQRAQERRAAVQIAGQKIENRNERRRAAREERIKRARIIQAAENTGAGTSSGVVGAGSALAASFGRSVAAQQSRILTAQGITAANLEISRAQSNIDKIDAYTQLFGTGVQFADSQGWFDRKRKPT